MRHTRLVRQKSLTPFKFHEDALVAPHNGICIINTYTMIMTFSGGYFGSKQHVGDNGWFTGLTLERCRCSVFNCSPVLWYQLGRNQSVPYWSNTMSRVVVLSWEASARRAIGLQCVRSHPLRLRDPTLARSLDGVKVGGRYKSTTTSKSKQNAFQFPKSAMIHLSQTAQNVTNANICLVYSWYDIAFTFN